MKHGPDSAAVLAIGDELLAGADADLNSPYIAHRLTEVGRHVAQCGIVGDYEEDIAEQLATFCSRHPLVFATGGLGPTLDDVTRHAAARAGGVELAHSAEAWEQVKQWYARSTRPMPASNERQALIPAGATVLFNRLGTAPGFRMQIGASTLIVLPGPPREMQSMFTEVALPWLADHPALEQVVDTHRFHLFGLSESVFADAAGAWMDREANPQMGVTVKGGVMAVRILARGLEADAVRALLLERAQAFRERFGEHVFSEEQPDLAVALGQELLAQGITIAFAESCTGGLAAAQLTRMAGISAVFREGFVTYSNEAKEARLGVPLELLDSFGAVSEPVAGAMAAGAARQAGARLAISVTGIAGPGGAVPGKPVGTVCFGTSMDGEVCTYERRYPDLGRDWIRERAAGEALDLGLRAARGAAGTP